MPSAFPESLSASCDAYMAETFTKLTEEQQMAFAENIRDCYAHAAQFCIQFILAAASVPGDRRCNPCAYLVDLHNQSQLLSVQALHLNGWLESSAVAS